MASMVTLGFAGLMFALFFWKTMRRFNQGNSLAEHIKEVSLNKKSFIVGWSLF